MGTKDTLATKRDLISSRNKIKHWPKMKVEMPKPLGVLKKVISHGF